MAGPDLFLPLQGLLDRGVAGSSDARSRCQELDGRSFAVRLRGLPLTVRFACNDGRLAVSGEDEADVTLEGSPMELARLAILGEPASAAGLNLVGDPLLARDFRDLLDIALPDWEEELSRITGDVAARRISRFLRSLGGWVENTGERLGTDLADYLKEEQRSLPSRWEMDEFLDAVDTLRADTDRLEARLRRLEKGVE
jgi:ubiquinone biosynthesis protein UbiJ